MAAPLFAPRARATRRAELTRNPKADACEARRSFAVRAAIARKPAFSDWASRAQPYRQGLADQQVRRTSGPNRTGWPCRSLGTRAAHAAHDDAGE